MHPDRPTSGPVTNARLAALDADGRGYALVTVVRTKGSSPREPGARMIVHPDGTIEGTIGGGSLEHRAAAAAQSVLGGTGSSCTLATYRLTADDDQCCGGEVEVLIQAQRVRPRVLLVGAGHVSSAIGRAIRDLPFDLTVIDDRAEWATTDRFPNAELIVDLPEDVLLDLPLVADSTYALVMTHSHKRDFEVLRLLVPRRLRYLGLIGSAAKWNRFRRALIAQGFRSEDVERVHCPIGIGVGGKDAAEIAISVAAEILAVRDGASSRIATPSHVATPSRVAAPIAEPSHTDLGTASR